MSVAPEQVSNDVGTVALDDLVKVVCWVRQRVASVPAGQNVANDPNAFAAVFGALELGDEPGEHAADVGVAGVEVIEDVGVVQRRISALPTPQDRQGKLGVEAEIASLPKSQC